MTCVTTNLNAAFARIPAHPVSHAPRPVLSDSNLLHLPKQKPLFVGKFDNFDLGTKSFHRMNWVRNYFTPLTFLCSARHAGATPYCAAPSAAALHSCPPWQPLGPHPAVQRLRARRHTCNVQRLAARRCTVTYPATWLGPPPPPPPPHHTLSHSLPELCPLSHSLPLSNPLPNLANLKNLSVDFEVKPSLKVIFSDPLVLIQVKFSHCSFVASLGKP